jgi:hypothetical protein
MVRMASTELMGLRAPRGRLELRARPGPRVRRGCQALLEKRARLARMASPVLWARRVRRGPKAWPELLAPWVHLGLRGMMAWMARSGLWAPRVHKESRASLGHLVQAELLERRVKTVSRVRMGSLERQECRVRRALRERQALLELLGRQGLRARMVLQAKMGSLAQQVLKVL